MLSDMILEHDYCALLFLAKDVHFKIIDGCQMNRLLVYTYRL